MNERVWMAEMIEYLTGTPNDPGSNPPVRPVETTKFFTCYFREKIMDVFRVQLKRRNFDRENYSKGERKRKASLYVREIRRKCIRLFEKKS